jgi:outer membrane lipoprotein SlyB
MKRLLAWGLIVIGFGTGCATERPRPSVHAYPARGQSAERMSRDVAECQAWAQQQTGYDPAADATKGAVVGTLIGGALGAGTGAAVGAATGNVGKGAATGAVLGGVAGGVTGGVYKYSKSKEGYDQAYAACIKGRGYVTGANDAPHQPSAPTPAAAPPPPAPVVVQSPPPPVVVQAPPPPIVVQAPPPPPTVVVVPSPPPREPVVVVEPRQIHVPPGHYPPRGFCRLWYPGRPPGHQPPPMACSQVTGRPGAFVLYNGAAWDVDYNWQAHARRHPGSVPPAILQISVR